MIEIGMHYTQLFFIYSILGFIWEVLWVSCQKRKLVNRGFLHGIYLPIYGFGAIVILLSTRPFIDSPFLVFVVGMVAATVLEWGTGVVIEKMFHVRYWDYDDRFLNYKGYICLRSSLFFGVMAVLLTKGVNAKVEELLQQHRTQELDVLTYVLLFVFFVDVFRSVREAFDLRALLQPKTWISYTFALKHAIKNKAYAGRDRVLRALEVIRPDEVLEDLKQKGNRGYRQLEFFLSDIVDRKRDQEQRIKNKWMEMFEDVTGQYQEISQKYRQAISDDYIRRKLRLDRLERSARSILRRNDATFQGKTGYYKKEREE